MVSSVCKDIIIISTISIVLLAFWFSIIGIYDQDKLSQTNSYPFLSPQIFSGAFSLVKQISFMALWHWKYETTINGINYDLVQACPTFKHDVYLKTDGVLQMRSDGKIFSTESEINIYDNHNNFIYKITTGNFWLTLLNQNKILVNFHLEDSNGKTIMYVDSTNLFNIAKNYIFKDEFGNVIATANKDITDFPWTWNVNVVNNVNSTTPVDIRLLMMVFAHSSFSEGGKNSKGYAQDKKDGCNGYFFLVCLIDGIFTGLWIIVLCIVFKDYIKEYYQKCKEKINRNKVNNTKEDIKSNQTIIPNKVEIV